MESVNQARAMSRDERGRQNMRVTVVGAAVNVVLFFVKLAGGILGHSQALVADAVHSLSDLLSDFGLILAIRFSSQPPDAEHPYGHERFETLAALATGSLLAVNGAFIGVEAAQRLIAGHLVAPEAWTLLVAAFAILVKESLYQYTIRVARRTRSAALRANAWDHRSDAISSVLVFIGIGGSLVGFPYLDSVVALLVALMVLRIGATTAWGALQELADRSLDASTVDDIRRVIHHTEGVRGLHLLKTRKMGHQALAEVHILVTPYLSVSEGHQIAERVRLALLREVPDLAEATIHIDSEDDEKGSPVLPPRSQIESALRAALRERGLPLPELITLHYVDGQVEARLQYPLPSSGSVERLRSQENEIRATLERRIQGVTKVEIAWVDPGLALTASAAP